jgi:hypothetical protein
LGDAYADLPAAQKTVVLDILAAAIRQTPPPETAAGLAAVAKNFPRFQPPERSKCLGAVLDLATQPGAAAISRERAIRLLNVVYPNLTPSERTEARSELEKARQQGESPALREFFSETVPQSDPTLKP